MPEMSAGYTRQASDQVVAASASNPNLVAATYEERAAREGVDVAAGQNLPEFGVQGTVNPNSASVLGVMSVPLYNGIVDPQVRASKDLVGQRQLELEAQRRQAEQTALVAWQDYRAAQGRIASYRGAGASGQGRCRGNDARVRPRPAARVGFAEQSARVFPLTGGPARSAARSARCGFSGARRHGPPDGHRSRIACRSVRCRQPLPAGPRSMVGHGTGSRAEP